MDLVFDLGSANEARGHALVYFKNRIAPGAVAASYVVVPPVSFDLSKYVPPMLATRIPQVDSNAIQFIPLPPVPEPYDSYEALRRTAEMRGDDLVYGGDIDPAQLESALMILTQAAQAYSELYRQRLSSPVTQQDGIGVSEVLYSLMGEKDRLSELAKLTGKLRYALDGSDGALIEETVHEMRVLAQYLPEKYKIKDLIRVAQLREDKGGRLAHLYLDRCFRISNEEYAEIEQIDRSILQLDSDA